MSVPKIGRSSEKSEKSDVLKIADDLAAKSRILRKQAESQDVILDRLRQLGDEFSDGSAAREEQRTSLYRSEQSAIIDPLLAKAHEYLKDGDSARIEAKVVISALESVNWDGLRAKFNYEHGLTLASEEARAASPGSAFSAGSTRERVGQLRAALDDLKEFVNASDSELREILQHYDFTPPAYPPDEQGPDGFPKEVTYAGGWRVSAHAQFQYAINALRRVLAYGPSGDSIRGKMAGINRLLSEIGEDTLVEAGNREHEETR